MNANRLLVLDRVNEKMRGNYAGKCRLPVFATRKNRDDLVDRAIQ